MKRSWKTVIREALMHVDEAFRVAHLAQAIRDAGIMPEERIEEYNNFRSTVSSSLHGQKDKIGVEIYCRGGKKAGRGHVWVKVESYEEPDAIYGKPPKEMGTYGFSIDEFENLETDVDDDEETTEEDIPNTDEQHEDAGSQDDTESTEEGRNEENIDEVDDADDEDESTEVPEDDKQEMPVSEKDVFANVRDARQRAEEVLNDEDNSEESEEQTTDDESIEKSEEIEDTRTPSSGTVEEEEHKEEPDDRCPEPFEAEVSLEVPWQVKHRFEKIDKRFGELVEMMTVISFLLGTIALVMVTAFALALIVLT